MAALYLYGIVAVIGLAHDFISELTICVILTHYIHICMSPW
jgi:predicted metal-dependent TIM-barrel fold hydrolase